jgi:hypothetical protein
MHQPYYQFNARALIIDDEILVVSVARVERKTEVA